MFKGQTATAEMCEIMDGMERVNQQMCADIVANAPMCHFRPMSWERSDSVDGYYEEWYECSVCGHKEL